MSRLLLPSVLCLALLTGSIAHAQAPAIERPKVTGETRVDYPKGAKGDAVVVLELVVDAEGAVRDVTIVSGEGAFAENASMSAWGWRFEPARQDGEPVPARIRFSVRFRQSPAAAAAREPGPRVPRVPTPEPSPEAQPAEPIEVTVYGRERSPAARTLTRAEVRELPGAFGDPFRAIEAMPGVSPIVSGVPYFFVRGAPPGNVGYFLDGVRVPLLFHVGFGPSVVHPALVERVDLYPGAAPVRFGRFAGGVVSAETMAPRREVHGEANVRLVDAGALVESPFDGTRGTVLVGGRYSYTGHIYSRLQSRALLEYWDYQARASYEVAPRDTLGVFAFGAYDYFGVDSNGDTHTALATEFHRVDLRWEHEASSSTTSRLAVTAGLDRTESNDEDPYFVRDRLLAVRTAVVHRPDDATLVSGGSEVMIDYYDVESVPADPDDPEQVGRFERFFPTRTDVATGLFGEVSVEVERGITLTPGLRVDLYASNGAAALGVDPRVAARFELGPRIRTIYTLGIAHQPPSFVAPVPGFQVGGLDGGLQRAVQSSAGVEASLPAEITGSLTLFQNAFFELSDVLGISRRRGGDPEGAERRSLGSSYGVEVLLKRPLTKKLGGMVAYTLSRTIRSVGREKFPAAFDRTHVLDVAGTYDLGNRWRAGARFLYYTGFPAEEAAEGRLRSLHPPRVPDFHRLDLRLEKKLRLGDKGYWALVFEVLNATFGKEVLDVSCDEQACTQREVGPIVVPSVGVEAVY